MHYSLFFLGAFLISFTHAISDYAVTTYPLVNPTKNTTKIFNIGMLGTYGVTNNSAPGVVRFMIEYLNQDHTILPDVLFQLYRCELADSKAQSLLAAQTLIETYNTRALIGGLYSDETEIAQLVASVYETPHIAATPTSPAMSDKTTYPYLFRMNPPAQYMNAAIIDFMNHYNWRQAFIIYSNDDYGTAGYNNLASLVSGTNITLNSAETTVGAKNFSDCVTAVKNAIDSSRMRVFMLYTQPREANIIMQELYAAGLVGETTLNTYVMLYATTIVFTTNVYNLANLPWFQGAVGLCSRGAIAGPLYTTLEAAWVAADPTLFVGSRPNLGPSWYYADAMYTLAYGLQKQLASGIAFENITGAGLKGTIVNTNFTGVTGSVFFDSSYDRPGDFVWYNYGKNDSTFNSNQIAAIYSPTSKSTTFDENDVTLIFNGRINPPDGVCDCVYGTCDDMDVCTCEEGWSGANCDHFTSAVQSGGGSSFTNADIIIVAVVPVVVVAFIIAAAIQFVRYKRKRMIKDLTQKQRSLIKREDIAMFERIGRGASGEVFKGLFRGTEVAVKKVTAGCTSAAAVEQFEMECAFMSSLRHPNIVLFMGMSVVSESNELLFVMELMEKGSLHDIVHNTKVTLSQALCLHIAYQAAKGMNFLHQSDPPIIHCDLKSHNILMDDKWNARISDFGITRFKSIKDTTKGEQKQSSLGTIYWTAPEVFAGKVNNEASDCYSFGIVLWELFHRQTPYAGKEPMLVALEVQRNLRPYLRPDLDPVIRDLITDCWAQDPVTRPDFEVIMNRLRVLTLQTPLLSIGGAEGYTEAPTGMVYLVATDIVGSNEIWEKAPMTMFQSIQLHNEFIRSTMEARNGYEVECNNNGFFLVFNNLRDTMNWCIAVQTGLVTLEWPDHLLTFSSARIEQVERHILFAGLRVRTVVHAGVPNCRDDSNGRMVYTGPVVERTKKILSTASLDASIVVSNVVVDHINTSTKTPKFLEELSIVICGEIMDSARSTESARNKLEKMYDVLPKSLIKRRQKIPEAGVPNLVELDEEEMDTLISMKPQLPLSWDIAYSDLEEKESVGKGTIGDYVRTMWKGKEVVQKILINQQLAEADLLLLKARASILEKLKHKNLLEFYGVCLEPNHVSLVVKYLPNSTLTSILNNASFLLSFAAKVNLAKQIAEAMDHLCSISAHTSWLAVNSNLKSANVLVMQDSMTVKLTDYGQGNLKDLARTMTSVGTIAWTAPEVLNGDEPSEKVAVYSFGIIMWEILTRSIPYANEHPIKVVSKIVEGYRPSIPFNCPVHYSELMSRCWDADPSKRPSWNEIISTLSSM